MAEVFGKILQFLGYLLGGVYKILPNYGVAIILLTIIVRIVLFPLAVKQIRSMTAMQKIQPRLKELQKKHKGDRQKLNEEMMKLYKEHGVNPLGGCFPMLLQLPVFIALYAVIRTGVPFAVVPAEPIQLKIPITKTTQCRVDQTKDAGVAISDLRQNATLVCRSGDKQQTVSNVAFKQTQIDKGSEKGKTFAGMPAYITQCVVPGGSTSTTKDAQGQTVTSVQQLVCQSPLGTGHLPRDGKLFRDLVHDKATFLGMHLACTPTQANTKKSIRVCTTATDAGGGFPLVGYYLLVALMVVTTWYQQKQMLARQSGQQVTPQQQQMQMMSKIMPVFMGFISLNFPAALSLYWVVGNLWMIGQQHFILQAQGGPDGVVDAQASPGGKPGGKPKPGAPNGRAARPDRSGRPGGGRPGAKPGKRKR